MFHKNIITTNIKSRRIVVSCQTPAEENDLSEILNGVSLKFLCSRSKGLRYIEIIRNFISSYLYLRKGINSLILGGPSLFNRVLALMTRSEFVCYMRSLHPSPNLRTSLIDKIWGILEKYSIFERLLNPYWAHKYLLTSFVNEKFLVRRGLLKNNKSKNFQNIGAYWLKNIPKKASLKSVREIVYISSAYASHMQKDKDERQLKSIRVLREYCLLNKINFFIKQHPRDYTDYKKLFYDKVRLLPVGENILLGKDESRLYISHFSTLLFEVAYLGGSAILLTTEDVMHELIDDMHDLNEVVNCKSVSDLVSLCLKEDYFYDYSDSINFVEQS